MPSNLNEPYDQEQITYISKGSPSRFGKPNNDNGQQHRHLHKCEEVVQNNPPFPPGCVNHTREGQACNCDATHSCIIASDARSLHSIQAESNSISRQIAKDNVYTCQRSKHFRTGNVEIYVLMYDGLDNSETMTVSKNPRLEKESYISLRTCRSFELWEI